MNQCRYQRVKAHCHIKATLPFSVVSLSTKPYTVQLYTALYQMVLEAQRQLPNVSADEDGLELLRQFITREVRLSELTRVLARLRQPR